MSSIASSSSRTNTESDAQSTSSSESSSNTETDSRAESDSTIFESNGKILKVEIPIGNLSLKDLFNGHSTIFNHRNPSYYFNYHKYEKYILPTDRLCLRPYQTWDKYDCNDEDICEENLNNLDTVINNLVPDLFVTIGPGLNTFSDLYMLAVIGSKRLVYDDVDGIVTLNDTFANSSFNGTFYKYKDVWFYDTDS